MHHSPRHQPVAFTRRRLLQGSATLAAFSILPGRILGEERSPSPNARLNIAGIGVGGMGAVNLARCAGTENIVALCDVDPLNYAAKTIRKYPNARVYTDYREMLEKQKDIDAIIIATPDHTHAPIALAAMALGKHVYVQKPLAHSVKEARLMTEAARRHKVVTQMGNQGHSGEGARLMREWVQAGIIGKVREVHCWTNRPVWPQGIEMERPKDEMGIPAGMDWDLWIGPARMRPFHTEYHPAKWRAWWDFGTGSLGDLGCHVIDPVFWALDLQYPSSVCGCISTYWEGFWKKTAPKNETYPRSTIVRYRFPARGDMPAVRLTWWDGGLMPPRPEELEPDRKMGDADGGVLIIGDSGTIMSGCYGRSPRLIPESRMKDCRMPAKTIERIPGGESGHEKDWLRACKGGKPASSNFDYAGPLSETVLMGNLAVRFPDRELSWDGERMAVTNDKEADDFVAPHYRTGWTL